MRKVLRDKMSKRTGTCLFGAAALAAAVTLPATASAAPIVLVPRVVSARAVPGAIGAHGAGVMIVGKVRNATTCRVVVLADPAHGHGGAVKVSLPKPSVCKDGTYRAHVELGPATADRAVVVKLALVAGPARGVFYVPVAPKGHPDTGAKHPVVVSVSAAPWHMGWAGGPVTVEGRVQHAHVCRLAVLADDGVPVKLPGPARCSSGAYEGRAVFGLNPRYSPTTVKLGLFPLGLARRYAGTFFVSLAGKPRPKPVVTTTTQPPVPATAPTSTSVPPPAPSVGGALPPSFPLPPATTTTTVPPATTTTTAPPPVTTTTTVPVATLTSTASEASYNWGGYIAEPPSGTAFSDVTGTFVVPTITSLPVSCNDVASAWVGVDGGTSTDTWLLQVGVNIGTENYQTGTCDTSKVAVSPWVDILTPGNEAPATTELKWDAGPLSGEAATVSPGDKVRVTVQEVSTGVWQVTLDDLSTGGVWLQTVDWGGPGQTAEWVVEDPDQPDNPSCTYNPSGTNIYMCPLPAFSQVSFSDLGASPGGSAASWEQSSVSGQDGSMTPGQLYADGAFDVSYSDSATVTFGPIVKTRGTYFAGR